MTEKEIKDLKNRQEHYFLSGATLPVSFRIQKLKKLYRTIQKREKEIARALQTDLGKNETESYLCEIGLTLSEIAYFLRHTHKLAAEHRVFTPIAHFAAKSFQKPSPYGNVLIMSPWNYPFLLTIDPLVDAIAAGNTVMLKPSAYSPATSEIIKKIVEEVFPPEHAAVIPGGRKENAGLLKMKFDLIFFTGSQQVGKEVLRSAAETITPTILELGGKSPCIVDETANIRLAAKRIVFGKFLNCGQTCVAPDYILCQEQIKKEFLRELFLQIQKQYGKNPLRDPDYGKIVNRKHFDRLSRLIDPQKTVFGGKGNPETQQIEPTVMDRVDWNDAVMQKEIFGPILPVLTFRSFDEIYSQLAERPKPLALYLFSENKKRIREVTERCRYGGGCVNDTIIHLATAEMGFGGVGESGMGAYHGKEGFYAFSHRKSIVEKKTWLDLPIRYRPYSKRNQKLLRLFLK